MTVKSIVALGSNVGLNGKSSISLVKLATLEFQCDLTSLLEVSQPYRAKAVPAGSGPDFVNAVMTFDTTLGAADLLAWLHDIEAKFDRMRPHRWAPRTLDLDLIAYGDHVLPSPETHAMWRDLPPQEQATRTPTELILPHPRLQDRAFVLVPLRELHPTWRHPCLGLTVEQMCDALPAEDLANVTPYGGWPDV